MIKGIENIFDFILYKTLFKFITFVLAFVIILNCVFSPLLMNINSNDLSTISDIQKDIFSAVFFVSNTIEKINFSLTSKIVVSNTQNSDSQSKENKNIPCKYNDFIITSSQTQNEFLKLQLNQPYNAVSYNNLLYDYRFIINYFYVFYNEIFCLLSIILLFYASIKKLYDNISKLNINTINSAFMYI